MQGIRIEFGGTMAGVEPDVRVSIMKGAAIAIAAVAAWLGMSWGQTTGLLSTGVTIEQSANSYVLAMNEQVEGFKGDPSSAVSVTPVLSVSRDAFGGLRQRTNSLPSPPGSIAYREALDEYLLAAGDYYGGLSDTCDFVLERTRAVSPVLQALQGLTAASSESEGELRSRVDSLAVLAENAAESIGHLDASTTAAYSAVSLTDWMGELNTGLRDLERGLESRDVLAVNDSSRRLGSLIKSDWDAMFFEADKGQLARLNRQRDRVERAQLLVARRRDMAAFQQRAYGLAAITAAVAAAVLAAMAWLR